MLCIFIEENVTRERRESNSLGSHVLARFSFQAACSPRFFYFIFGEFNQHGNSQNKILVLPTTLILLPSLKKSINFNFTSYLLSTRLEIFYVLLIHLLMLERNSSLEGTELLQA